VSIVRSSGHGVYLLPAEWGDFGVNGKWLRAGCAAAAVAMLAAGCSSVGGGNGGNNANTMSAMNSMSFGPPEKTTLNVGVVPAMDSAGFFIALHEGLFAKEGLTINYTPATSSETAVKEQVGKNPTLDISGGNYVSYIQEAMKGEPIEVVAEGSIMQQGSQVMFTTKNSGIQSLADLKGHTIAVNAPQNIDYLLTVSVLQENGIDIKDVTFPSGPIAFPTMANVLASGGAKAATMPEPFASLGEQNGGLQEVADLDQGATQNFPIEGYVVSKQWAAQNPNTLDRFLAALEAGQEIADTNRDAVEQAFETLKSPQDGQVPPQIAAVMALNNYPIGIDLTRLQRVSNVMFEFGLEPGRSTPYNVKSMLLPTGAFNFTPFETSAASS
jgi:NitT/TauT family transport system substrate-binding protein